MVVWYCCEWCGNSVPERWESYQCSEGQNKCFHVIYLCSMIKYANLLFTALILMLLYERSCDIITISFMQFKCYARSKHACCGSLQTAVVSDGEVYSDHNTPQIYVSIKPGALCCCLAWKFQHFNPNWGDMNKSTLISYTISAQKTFGCLILRDIPTNWFSFWFYNHLFLRKISLWMSSRSSLSKINTLF